MALPSRPRLWMIEAVHGDPSRAGDLARLVPRLRGHRVTVIGDPVLDVYLYGSTERVSREAPVLIVREERRESRLGGAANAAANLAALGAEVALVGLVGKDDAASELSAIARAAGIDVAGLVARTGCRTVTKTRILAGGLHTRKQQMLRVDREDGEPADDSSKARLVERSLESAGAAEAVVISEYGHGQLTPALVEIADRCRAAGKIVIVDSRRSLAAFRGVNAVTPNEPEIEAALGVRLRTEDDALSAAERLTEMLGVEATLLTRGREGMAIATKNGAPVLIPAHGAHEALDVTGAGDTVVATFTLALAAGADVLSAARLANSAASVVVRSMGAACCSPEELLEALATGGRTEGGS